jgi:hypothetical protein
MREQLARSHPAQFFNAVTNLDRARTGVCREPGRWLNIGAGLREHWFSERVFRRCIC